MARIRVVLLGGFAAFGPDGEALALPTRKAEALIALLACRAGEAQPRERLTALLWGDRSDRQARHSLSQTLTSIRATIGDEPDPFAAERETLAANPDAIGADVIDLLKSCRARRSRQPANGSGPLSRSAAGWISGCARPPLMNGSRRSARVSTTSA